MPAALCTIYMTLNAALWPSPFGDICTNIPWHYDDVIHYFPKSLTCDSRKRIDKRPWQEAAERGLFSGHARWTASTPFCAYANRWWYLRLDCGSASHILCALAWQQCHSACSGYKNEHIEKTSTTIVGSKTRSKSLCRVRWCIGECSDTSTACTLYMWAWWTSLTACCSWIFWLPLYGDLHTPHKIWQDGDQAKRWSFSVY